ncbi:hypothetical protein V5O48_014774 [Marasmius crinis-equi]|uniref:Uncharacterized protein n=1 Tax=Marasmius crinis-equi TaxID=585013 RepID=A0ABR3EWC7_9AGAR
MYSLIIQLASSLILPAGFLRQYNAVTESSTNAGDNAELLGGQPQVAAISVLLSGMALNQDSGSDSPVSPTSSSEPPSTVPKGAIVGGVMGGIAGIGLLIVMIWLYRRGIKGPRESPDPECVVTPFDLPVSALDQKSPRTSDPKQAIPGASSNPMIANSVLPPMRGRRYD